ncbi:MAG: efflux RND transporter periplasmic adaptor subunit [Tannerellaceae bacterium]
MNKKVKWSLFGAIGLLIAGMAIYPKLDWNNSDGKKVDKPVTSSPSGGKASRALNVNAEILKFSSLSENIKSTGSTLPDEEVDLTFETSGKITDIFFTEGSCVRKNDLLAKVNDKPLQAQLRKLEAQLPLAKERVYRQKTLLAKDAVSQEAYEQVTTELEKLEADIDLVKANLAQTELRAPFDGVIGLRSISEGAYASPNTVIAKLTRISPMKIDFSFPERYAGIIKNGTDVTFRIGGILEPMTAKVYAVESKIDPSTRTVKARALYPNTNRELQAGRYAGIEINMKEIPNALTIPSEALIPEMGKEIVYLYNNGKANPVEVKTGIRTESRIQIIDGLLPGDTLLTSGVMQLRKSMPVILDRIN